MTMIKVCFTLKQTQKFSIHKTRTCSKRFLSDTKFSWRMICLAKDKVVRLERTDLSPNEWSKTYRLNLKLWVLTSAIIESWKCKKTFQTINKSATRTYLGQELKLPRHSKFNQKEKFKHKSMKLLLNNLKLSIKKQRVWFLKVRN